MGVDFTVNATRRVEIPFAVPLQFVCVLGGGGGAAGRRMVPAKHHHNPSMLFPLTIWLLQSQPPKGCVSGG